MRSKLNWWLWNDSPDWFADRFGDHIARIICFIYGHIPIPDQCNMPEHDLCAYCQKLMPYAYIRFNKDGTHAIHTKK